MPGFSQKKILSSETLGDKLQRARQETNLSLYDISQTIKIKKEYLDYLRRIEAGKE